jgi:hypothetical protein
MRLETTATVETAKQVELSPEVATGLRAELDAYAAKQRQVKQLESEMNEHRKVIEVTRALIGEKMVTFDGYVITLIEPVQTRLDKAELLRAGVSIAQLEAGTVSKPSKPYIKIRVPDGSV